jgi:Tol biopolymer transport system component
MHTSIGAVAWSGGETLVFDSETASSITYLWRVTADGSPPAQRLELAGISANAPVTCRTQNRLIFSRGQYDEDVFEFEPGRPPSPVLVSRFSDEEMDIATDGRLVFASTRSGEHNEIWLANADGSDPHQLAHGPGIQQGSPHWSPDGTRIVFDSLGDDGHWHIWLIDAVGGPPTQLTHGQGYENIPTWSADGRAIYYSAAQPNSDHRDICHLTLSNGQVTRITQTQPGTSSKAYEWGPAPSIVYKQGDGNGPLFLQPTAGGPGTQLNLCVRGDAFYVRPVGIFYVSCGEEGDAILRVNDPRTGMDRILGRLDGYWEFGDSTIAVSPDGGRVLYERGVQQVGRHLMMIENFR